MYFKSSVKHNTLNLTLYFEWKTISKYKPEELIHTHQIIHQTGILWLVNWPVTFSVGKNTWRPPMEVI